MPYEVDWRLFCSPVPAYTTLGFERAIATSPKVLTAIVSKTLRQVIPRFVLFHRPPEADATKIVEGSRGSASTS